MKDESTELFPGSTTLSTKIGWFYHGRGAEPPWQKWGQRLFWSRICLSYSHPENPWVVKVETKQHELKVDFHRFTAESAHHWHRKKLWQSLQNFAKVLPSIPVASVRIEFRSQTWWINVDHQTNVSTLTQSTYMLYFLLASSFTTFEALSLLPSTNPILALLRAWFDSTKTLEGSFHGAPGPRNVFTDLRDITTGTSPCWDAISTEQFQNQRGIC